MSTLRRWLVAVATFLLDTFAALTGFYYSRKYAAIVKRLAPAQRPAEDDAQSGLIIIQIDGLSYEHLLQAVDRGRVPNISKMLKRGELVAARWRCGLPSTTPACQAGIMFGDNNGIPAFRWYDKLRRQTMMFKSPPVAAEYQSQLEAVRPGILFGGSSYVNVFDGGAYNSLFTLSTIEPHSLFEGVRGAGLVVIFLLNPLRVLRVLLLALQEYLTDALQRVSSRWRGQSHLPFLGIFPFLRIFSNVVFREIETFAVLVDIYRGVPAIYATYYGYDEVAHHFGIDSMAAAQSLRRIDQSVGQIERLQRANVSRSYCLVLLGDHGLTASVPFSDRYGETIGQYVARRLGLAGPMLEEGDGEHQQLYQTQFLMDELRAIEKNLAPTAAKVARRIRLLVQRRLAVEREGPMDWDVDRYQDVVVKSSGSLAHVYFNICNRRMDLSEISAIFPGLVTDLLAHEGIWLVAGREGEQILIMDEDSILTFGPYGDQHLEGEHPLIRLPDPCHAAEQIVRIARYPQSGDLILFGDYDAESGVVVCFERQLASHGGLGGPQDFPAIVYPRSLGWDLSGVRDSRDLYQRFMDERRLAIGDHCEAGEHK